MSTDPVNGCLGFLDKDSLFFAFVPFGIFAAFFGSAGYVICLLFYSPVITSNAYLLEPFIAQAMGFFAGVDRLPGILTLFGALLAIVGIMWL